MATTYVDTQDIVAGLDLTGVSELSATAIYQSINNAVLRFNARGLVLYTVDLTLGEPNVPDANTVSKFKNNLWLRLPHASDTTSHPILYFWSPNQASDADLLQWVRVDHAVQDAVDAADAATAAAAVAQATANLALSTANTAQNTAESALNFAEQALDGLTALTARVVTLENETNRFATGDEKATYAPTVYSTVTDEGWLEQDGSSVSRSVFARLFAVLGTTHGAVDSDHFTLPDHRGRTGVGAGTGPTLTARTIGQTFGAETHALTEGENGAHAHNGLFADQKNNWTGLDPTEPAMLVMTDYMTPTPTVSECEIQNSGTLSSGSGTPHNNMQPSIVKRYLIKT